MERLEKANVLRRGRALADSLEAGYEHTDFAAEDARAVIRDLVAFVACSERTCEDDGR